MSAMRRVLPSCGDQRHREEVCAVPGGGVRHAGLGYFIGGLQCRVDSRFTWKNRCPRCAEATSCTEARRCPPSRRQPPVRRWESCSARFGAILVKVSRRTSTTPDASSGSSTWSDSIYGPNRHGFSKGKCFSGEFLHGMNSVKKWTHSSSAEFSSIRGAANGRRRRRKRFENACTAALYAMLSQVSGTVSKTRSSLAAFPSFFGEGFQGASSFTP